MGRLHQAHVAGVEPQPGSDAVLYWTQSFAHLTGMTTSERYDILVEVESNYIEEQSDPDEGRYVFSYTITISNQGALAAKLLTRHWIITDANQKVQEVRGEGVVGQQPFLRPGEAFRYTSGCLLETPVGSMRGSYQMVAEDGTDFSAQIPMFTLSMPRVLH